VTSYAHAHPFEEPRCRLKDLPSGTYLRESEASLTEPSSPALASPPSAEQSLGADDDTAAKQAVYRATLRQVWGVLRKKGCPESELLDLAQKTYWIAFSKWDSFRGDSRRETWVVGIALNVARAYLRQQRANQLEAFDEERDAHEPASADPSTNPEEQLHWRQRMRVLASALEQLDPEQRALLKLVLQEQVSVTDAARSLGMSTRRGYTVRDAGVARLAEIFGSKA